MTHNIYRLHAIRIKSKQKYTNTNTLNVSFEHMYIHHEVKRIRVATCNGEGNGTPLQYSCLENPMDRGA